MKKDQNLPNKNIHSNNSSGKPLPNISNYSRQQSSYNKNYRGRSPYQRNSRVFSQNRYSRSHSRNSQYQNNYSRSNSNQLSRNRNYSNNRSRNSSYNRYRNYSNNRNGNYSNDRNPRYQNNRSRDYSTNRSKYNSYQNRSRDNSQNKNSSYNNRQRNYSQSPHRNNTSYQNSLQNYRSSTLKHQRQLNQVQSTADTQPDLPGIENNESPELQLNQINCESTDSESDRENTISINMINVENDYEPIIYEQPIFSHINQNHDQYLLNYYTRPVSNSTTKKKKKL